ncbi:MAG: aminotransferase class I/II-fold pyridoxal phosphate-dependent enzyme [Bacteroidales bacterium]|nr:aminotransferase class I/II-fold pyridoxal phosphate-dependent enzyme [Bacteroidales bacterium]
MRIKDFAVERYFARYEFSAKYLLSSSDCDGYAMNYVLGLASDSERQLWEKLTLGYTETLGSEFLRNAIQQHYQSIQMDEILVASPGEANFILMNVLLSAGDHVVCMAPMYQSLYQVAMDIGCEVTFWNPLANPDSWYYNPDDLKALIRDNTKLIIVNFPHNPTGYSPNIDELNSIVELARSRGIAIFSDEMYRFLNHGSVQALPSVSDLYENSVSLWGTAKTFGLAGLRLGWLTSKNKPLLRKIEAFKDYLSICSSAPSEVLGTIALNHLDSFVKPNNAKIRANISHFEQFHQRNSNLFDFPKPTTGSTAFIKLNIKESALNFAERLVKDTGIMILPSELFDYGSSHVRIGFGRENMPEVLEILDSYLNR